MAGASDFKVKKGLQVHGGDINLGQGQDAVIQVDARSSGTGRNLTISAGESSAGGSAGGSLNLATSAENSGGTNKIVIGPTGVTTLTAGGDLDIGSHDLKAETLTSDVSTGTAPLVVASTTNVANLNASTLSGATFAAPGAIGGGTAAAGTFTTLTGTSLTLGDGNITNVGDINADSISVDAAGTGLNVDFSGANTGTGVITLNDGIADALSITDGTNDWMVFNTSAETLTFGRNSTFSGTTIANLGTVTTADINGGTIDGATIGGSSAGAITGTTITATTSVLGTLGGNVDHSNYNSTNVDINSGAIDGTTVGASSASSGAFTTLAASGAVTFGSDGSGVDVTFHSATSGDKMLWDASDEKLVITGTSSATALEIADGNVTVAGSTTATSGLKVGQIDALSSSGDISVKMSNNRGGAVNFLQGSDSYMKFVTTTGEERIILSPEPDGNGVCKVVIGDNAAEDTMLVFDGTEIEYRLGIDDSADHFEIGVGDAHDTTSALILDSAANVVTIGVDSPSDGDVLTYTTTGTNRWKPASASSAAISTSANNGSSSATDNTILYYNGASNSSVQSSTNLIFNDTDLQIAAAGKTQYRDSAIYIHSSTDGQLDIDADGEIEMATASLDIDATTSVTIDTPDLKINGSASGKPVLTLTNTNADGDGATVKLVKDGSSPAAEDIVGTISFSSEDDGSNTQVYGTIVTKIEDPGAGSEQGKMLFNVAENDGTVTQGLALTGSGTNGEIDVTIGAGSSSVTTIVGDLTVSGTTTTVSSTTLEVTDDLITVSKGNDTIANADGSGVEIDATGATNLYWKYVHSNTAWTSNVDIDTATTSDVYKIAGTSVLTNNTLGSGVVSSSLTSVGALNSGSITSGFGTIDTGSSAITTTGLITGGSLDIDDVVINGTTIGHTDDTDLLTVADGSLTLAGTLNQESTVLMDSYSATLTTTSATTMFTLASNAYSAAKVIVSVWLDDGSDHRSVGEYLFTYQGASTPSASSNIHMTEYALVETGGSALATFDAVKSSGNILFQITPGSSTSTKVRAQITQFVI